MPARAPLLVRPGARYECHGDGLCCSDVHALGPLSKSERERVVSFDPRAAVTHPRLGLPVLATTTARCCVFLARDGACRIHREHGAEAKPAACRRFPLSAVATPRGVRVVTAHRCPCRTMGALPLLDEPQARAALSQRGRLVVDDQAPKRIPLTRRRRVGFAAYETLEARAFIWLASKTCEDDRAARERLPELDDMAWLDLAHAYRGMVDGTTSGEALGWFGDALLSVLEGKKWSGRARPWTFAFERAERRIDHPRPERELFADFACDYVHSLRWAHEGSLGGALAQLVVALTCAARVAREVRRAGAGEERAAAEAVLVAEIALAGPLGYARFAPEVEAQELGRLDAVAAEVLTTRL